MKTNFWKVFLCCLFLGGLGVHRFVVGKTKSGIIQLLTLGGLGIWTLIDLIQILRGRFKDAAGNIITNPKPKTSWTIAVVWLSLIFCSYVSQIPTVPEIPTTIEIKSDSIVFRDWNDKQDFFKKLGSFTKASINQWANASDEQAKALGQQSQNEIEALKTEFRAEGRILNVPIGTKIAISAYCDENGNETEPVWNDPQKTFYTPDGNFVWVSGEWQGHNFVTMLSTSPQ